MMQPMNVKLRHISVMTAAWLGPLLHKLGKVPSAAMCGLGVGIDSPLPLSSLHQACTCMMQPMNVKLRQISVMTAAWLDPLFVVNERCWALPWASLCTVYSACTT